MKNAKSVLAGVGIGVATFVFAAGSIWPFLAAWYVHGTPAFQASRAWALSSPDVGALTGPDRILESDWFPKGGSANGEARFEHKLVGEKRKLDLSVILKEQGGQWVVTRAAVETDDGWDELTLH